VVFDRNTIFCTAVAAAAAVLPVAVGCSNDPDLNAMFPSTAASTSRIVTANGQFIEHDAILGKYRETGGKRGWLGMPISQQLPGPNGGQYSRFQFGVIYWSPRSGAHIVQGDIWLAFEFDGGGPGGPLGYPVSDQKTVPGGLQTEFEHGTITYSDGQSHIAAR
jgi:uncharacterized protein with LGFP repeats